MSSHYSIVQYVPDLVADERINLGVIVVSGRVVRVRFLRNWRRVSAFGRQDVSVLRDFAQQLEDLAEGKRHLPTMTSGDEELSHERLSQMALDWKHGLQLSEPRGSLLGPDQLLDLMAERYLRERHPDADRSRDKRTAAQIAASAIQSQLVRRVGILAGDLVHRNAELRGKHQAHRLDVLVKNGRPFFGAQALSFEVRDLRSLDLQINSTAWIVDDVKKALPKLPLAIVALPPRRRAGAAMVDAYSRAQDLFRSLEAPVLVEAEVAAWAERQSKTVPASLVQ